jgi:hypothetical protein
MENKFHGVKFSLKSWYWLSYSRFATPFYETRYIAVFTRVHHSPHPESDKSYPHSPNLFTLILMLYSHLRLGLPSEFPSTGYNFVPISYMSFMHATYHIHVILPDSIIHIFCKENKIIWNLSIHNFLQPFVISSPLSKYSSQRPDFKHPQSMIFLPLMWRKAFHTRATQYVSEDCIL